MRWVSESIKRKMLLVLLVVSVFSSGTICNAGGGMSTLSHAVGRGYEALADHQLVANPTATVKRAICQAARYILAKDVKWTEEDFALGNEPPDDVLKDIDSAVFKALEDIDSGVYKALDTFNRSAGTVYKLPKYWVDLPMNAPKLEYEIQVEIQVEMSMNSEAITGRYVYQTGMEIHCEMRERYRMGGFRKMKVSAVYGMVTLSYDVRKVPDVGWTVQDFGHVPRPSHHVLREIPLAIYSALSDHVESGSRFIDNVPIFTQYSPRSGVSLSPDDEYAIDVEMILNVRPLPADYVYGRANRIFAVMEEQPLPAGDVNEGGSRSLGDMQEQPIPAAQGGFQILDGGHILEKMKASVETDTVTLSYHVRKLPGTKQRRRN